MQLQVSLLRVVLMLLGKLLHRLFELSVDPLPNARVVEQVLAIGA